MKEMAMERLRELCEIVGDFTLTVEPNGNDSFLFCLDGGDSSYGRDMYTEINAEKNTVESFFRGLEQYVRGFEPSKEAMLWLDSTGHGVNGAPYEMRDVLACEEEYLEQMTRLCSHIKHELLYGPFFTEINYKDWLKFIKELNDKGKVEPTGDFLTQYTETDGTVKWIAIDNNTGEWFSETFDTRIEALQWLFHRDEEED